MVDLGLTNVALPVSNLNDSITFYTKYARMQHANVI
jgi:catechol 2,3-dioxygenase-like lactoylglutathione lyase family enzyme